MGWVAAGTQHHESWARPHVAHPDCFATGGDFRLARSRSPPNVEVIEQVAAVID
jgi:hypothetical protein